jgi:predicted transposase YbfD/YdcC
LAEVLLLCLLAVLAGAETITDIARFGDKNGLAAPASSLAADIRDHWAIENSLHWVLDMVFRDDECRLRTTNVPANFTTLKHMALNLIRRANSNDSIRSRRKVAAWDDEFLVSLITAA